MQASVLIVTIATIDEGLLKGDSDGQRVELPALTPDSPGVLVGFGWVVDADADVLPDDPRRS